MSKRRPGLKPRDRDDWATPLRAVVPLLELLEPGTRFIEPCCGAGELVGHLESAGHVCVASYDLPIDARTARYTVEPDTIFITNVPWRRRFEPNRIIANLSDQQPLWGLIYTDWLFTSHAVPYLPRVRVIAAIGRVKWIPDSESGGMENPGQTYEPEVPVEVREWIAPALASPDVVLEAQPPAQPHRRVSIERPIRLADGSYREVVRPSAQRAVHFAHQRCGLLPCA